MIMSNLSLILPRAHQAAQMAPNCWELDKFFSEIRQLLKKQLCILYNYRVKFAKDGKILIPEDFHRAPSFIWLSFRIQRDFVSGFYFSLHFWQPLTK